MRKWFQTGDADSFFQQSERDMYMQQYMESMYLVINCVWNQFGQLDTKYYDMWKNFYSRQCHQTLRIIVKNSHL